MRERCPLAVCAVTPAVSASSDAVWARPSIRSDSMAARAGSPIRAATSDKALTVIMAGLYVPARPIARVNHSAVAEGSGLVLGGARQAAQRLLMADLLGLRIVAAKRAELGVAMQADQPVGHLGEAVAAGVRGDGDGGHHHRRLRLADQPDGARHGVPRPDRLVDHDGDAARGADRAIAVAIAATAAGDLAQRRTHFFVEPGARDLALVPVGLDAHLGRIAFDDGGEQMAPVVLRAHRAHHYDIERR